MAYTDDAVLAKLSALNETHDSIATAAQWIMFHRRHAERTVQLWFQRLKDSPSPKRLNLVYLANEVTQQSKARHKEDFVLAFAPVIAEAIASAYKGAPSEVQSKLRRVIEVWRDRTIFEVPIQDAVEKRLDELDRAKGTSRTAIGGSIFGNSNSNSQSAAAAVPQEFAPLVAAQQGVTKLLISTQGSVSKADTDYEKVLSGEPPAAPVHAARLTGLLRSITDGEDAMAQMIKARLDMKAALDVIQVQYQKLLDADKQRLQQLEQRRLLVGDMKRQVEDKIMRELSGDNNAAGHSSGSATLQEPERPQMEALTPPSNEPDEPVYPGADDTAQPEASNNGAHAQEDSGATSATTAIDILSHLASAQAVPVSANGTNKRRRVDTGEELPDLDDGIDADVAESLRQDSLGQ
ncbi:hypothetical protein F503_07245 [Ophiostoma piceae UAMH 11346]|uniref:CID domain-containing protein n=1 Tax=Ophiostoma piceae (strain UAMH 11346) TaxID=1262450 RepID=S3C7E2_OPHP1|nr:hypothetical protein F503_07245 [Ophiostoma piceae UAMH 11346]